MDISSLTESFVARLGDFLPRALLAIVFLVVGWLVAVAVRALLRKTLNLLKVNHRIQSGTGSKLNVENGVATGAYFLVLLLALIAFFETLRLALVSEPLQYLVEQILGYLPNLVAGGALIIIAWLLATVARKAVAKGLGATRLDDRLSAEAGMKPMSENLGGVVYALIILLFVPAILDALELNGLLAPIQGMVDKSLDMLPNIVAAAALGIVGWFLAKILRNLVSSLLAAAGADRLGQRAGLAGTMTLSKLVGLIVFIFVFVPALIAALQALRIEAISTPATDMLGTLMAAVPNLFAAAIIIAIAFFVSDLVGNLAANLLGGMGFDGLPRKLGLGGALPADATASRLVGRLFVFFIMLFATVEAANVLGFTQVSDLVSMFIQFGGQVLLGVVIIAVGLWISSLAHGAIRRLETPRSAVFAGLARFAILGIVFAMGLRAMGIADDIVNLAFGLTLGAVAVAVALAFGLGGREAAGKQMEHWLSGLRGERR